MHTLDGSSRILPIISESGLPERNPFLSQGEASPVLKSVYEP